MSRRTFRGPQWMAAYAIILAIVMAPTVSAKDNSSWWWPWGGSSSASVKKSAGKQSNVVVRTANGATKMVGNAASGTTKAVTGAAKSVGNMLPSWGSEKKTSSRTTKSSKYLSNSKREPTRTAFWPWGGSKQKEQETLNDWMRSPRPD